MKFIHDAPAILYQKSIIVGDTHFGIEQRLKQKGVYINDLSERLAEQLLSLAKRAKANQIIFLGDVKDDLTQVSYAVERVFAKLKSAKLKLIVVRGNHDGGIEKLGVEVFPSSGLLFGDLALVHGHSWPAEELMQAKYLVSAHQHPQFLMNDKFGNKHAEPIWVVANASLSALKKHYKNFNHSIKLITIPAFNPLVGFPVKKLSAEQLGPILNNKLFKWNEALVYNLQGICMGKIRNL